MSKFAEAILSAFGMAAKDAKDDQEMNALVTTTMTALDAEPAEKAKEETAESAPAQDSAVQDALDAITKRLEALEHKNDQEEKTLHDEEDLDDLIEKLAGKEAVEKEASVTIPADEMKDTDPAARDAAVELLKKVRPAVAAIKDVKERARVVDALLSTVQGPNVMGQVLEATQAHARQAADAAQASTFEARCRESEAAYAARNPHKKKED